MSRVVHIGSTRDPKPDPLHELDIDELVERLSASEIQKLLDECDPDDPHIPPSMRNNYKCEKEPTGPLDKKKLNGENAGVFLFFFSFPLRRRQSGEMTFFSCRLKFVKWLLRNGHTYKHLFAMSSCKIEKWALCTQKLE